MQSYSQHKDEQQPKGSQQQKPLSSTSTTTIKNDNQANDNNDVAKFDFKENKKEMDYLDNFYKLNFPKTEEGYSFNCFKNQMFKFPFVVNQSFIKQQEQIHNILFHCITKIVNHYFKSPKLQERLQIPTKIFNKLKNLKTEYNHSNVGTFRPDILLTEEPDDHYNKKEIVMKVCEINARFCLNAYLLGEKLNQWFQSTNPILEKYFENDSFEPFEKLNNVTNIFFNENQLNLQKPIGILKGREKGFDIHLFLNNLQQNLQNNNTLQNNLYINNNLQNNFILIEPNELQLNKENNKLIFKNQEIEQFILELHQDEILNLKDEILDYLIFNCKVVNDFRTIFIVHDKRFLGILFDKELMKEELLFEDEIVDLLQKIIVPTFHLKFLNKLENYSLPNTLQQNYLQKLEKDDWILKPYLFGKGEGIIFGEVLKTQEEWLTCCKECEGTHVLQKRIQQPTFYLPENQPIYFPPLNYKNNQQQPNEKRFTVVCTALCIGQTFLGPGIFRFADLNDNHNNNTTTQNEHGAKVIALSRNGNFAHALKTKAHSPFHSKIIPQDCIFHDVNNNCCLSEKSCFEEMKEKLERNGVLFISMNFKDDKEANYLNNLICYLGIPSPNNNILIDKCQCQDLLNHDELNCPFKKFKHEFIWDITFTMNGIARSHSLEEFEFHTDASFETVPPHYIALETVFSDKLGCGQFMILDVNEIFNTLSKEHLDCLKKKVFKIAVPPEFRKDKDYIVTNILFKDDTCQQSINDGKEENNGWSIRYRRDIILNRLELNEKQREALNLLDNLLNNPSKVHLLQIPENTIIILDNHNFLHGRFPILDERRLLKRIRFHKRKN
ncbi:hypothetical protein ABK040_005031 [Willaertia magna]